MVSNVELRLRKIRELLGELIILNELHTEFNKYVNKILILQLIIDFVLLVWLVIITNTR